MTQRDLALAMEESPRVISEVIRGKRPVTVDFALALERALGIGASLWFGLQADYDLTVARNALKKKRRTSRSVAKTNGHSHGSRVPGVMR